MIQLRIVISILLLVPVLTMAKQKTILINSEQQDCIGWDTLKTKCLEYKVKGKDKSWQFLYHKINGFSFEPGYMYTLKINEIKLPKAPANSSNVKWTLVKILKKERVPVMEYGELIGNKKSIEGKWQFTKMMLPGSTFEFSGKKEMIQFDDRALKVNGKASCNSFFGSYTRTGHEIKFGSLGSTKMACPNLETETKMMKAIETVNMWEIKGNKLLLKNVETIVFELKYVAKKTI